MSSNFHLQIHPLGGSSHLVSWLVHPNYKWINPTKIPCKSLGLYPTYEPWVVRHQAEFHGFQRISSHDLRKIPPSIVSGSAVEQPSRDSRRHSDCRCCSLTTALLVASKHRKNGWDNHGKSPCYWYINYFYGLISSSQSVNNYQRVALDIGICLGIFPWDNNNMGWKKMINVNGMILMAIKYGNIDMDVIHDFNGKIRGC